MDNFDEPEPLANKPETILGLVIMFMLVSWICVLLRLYVRLRIVRAPGWDDFFVGLYLVTTTVGSVSIALSVKYGLGKHVLLLTPDQIQAFLKTFYVSNGSYTSSTAFIKLALLLQYMRIFEAGTGMHRIVTGLTIFTSLWGTAYSFMAWVPCFPVDDYWTRVITGNGNCYAFASASFRPFIGTYLSHTAINMLLDISLLAIPLPLFLKEGSSFAARARLVALLCMGCMVIALAAWRLATLVAHQVATYPTPDPTWYGPITMLLASIEINVASVCSSVPIFWPVLTRNNGIFVTQEIKITRELRHDEYGDEDGHSLTKRSTHSKSGSDADLSRAERFGINNKHYRDSYILRQVDPLRHRDERTQPSATAVSIKEVRRKWTKF